MYHGRNEMPILISFLDRHRAGNQRPLRTLSLDIQRSPDQAGTIVHNPQSHTGGVASKIGEGQSIILDRESQVLRLSSKADRHAGSLPVFDSVRQGFLGDFIEL